MCNQSLAAVGGVIKTVLGERVFKTNSKLLVHGWTPSSQHPCLPFHYLKKNPLIKNFLLPQASNSRTWDSIFRENKSVTSTRYAPSKKKSILNEDHQSKETIDYLQLLQQLEPNLYRSNVKTTEKLSSFISNRKSLSHSATFDPAQSRKIPLLHSRNFSSSVITLEDSDGEGEVTEIIELDEDDEKLVSVFDKYKSEYIIPITVQKKTL